MNKLAVAKNAHLRGDTVKAERLYREILRKSFNWEAAANLGVILIQRTAYAQAEHFLRKASKEADDPTVFANLAVAMRNQGRKKDACELLEEVCAQIPYTTDTASTVVNYGATLFDRARYEEAEGVLLKAVELAPENVDANWNLALSQLAQGKWQDGWPLHKWGFAAKQRLARPYVKRYREWLGEDLRGKTLLVWGEQGVGDELMFATCLKEMDCNIVFDCHPRLEDAFKRSFPDFHIKGSRKSKDWEWLDDIHIDYHGPIGKIPEYTRLDDAAFETQPYLVPDAKRVEHWKKKLPGIRIGFTWEGGAAPTGRHERSMPIDTLTPLLHNFSKVNWICLQYGEIWRDLQGYPVFYDAAAVEDFDEQINLTAACDLVISVVQTSVHVAGSLGVETWCMTPVCRPWKFPLGEKMPWHPTVRQFHQTQEGNWHEVVLSVHKELKVWIANRQYSLTESSPVTGDVTSSPPLTRPTVQFSTPPAEPDTARPFSPLPAAGSSA